MHISLDSALGRQRRLNSVGESVFQIAPDAAAGYSLRSLTGGDPAVVRVRRESDNNERDFRSSEINSGGMVRWVNEQITPPLDLRELTATGRDGPIIEAAAAYSLRNLSDSYTGDVVDVRRSSDGNPQSFTAAEVADGTLEDWVNEALNIKTYDFSTNAGGLGNPSNITLEGGESAGGVDDALKMSVVSTGTNAVHRCYQNLPSIGSGSSLRITFRAYRPSSNVNFGKLGFSFASGFLSENVSAQFFSADDAWEEFTFYQTSGTSTRFYLQLSATNGAGSLKSVYNGTTGDHVFVKDLSIDVVSSTGTVSKWYDQSTTSGVPNANHAVQTSTGSQPKIVDGGVLLNKVTFDGVNDYMNIASLTTLSNPFTYIQVVNLDSRNGFYPSVDGIDVVDDRVITGNGQGTLSDTLYAGIDGIEASPIVAANALRSYFFRGDATSQYYRNGISVAQGDVGSNTPSSGIRIAADHDLSGSNYTAIEMQEFIIYDTDQTDNRTALEANIGEVYGIAGIPAYEDTVNGFVETWYDQSGNGNDATQLTAGKQPKIVDAGALVTGGIDFDGTNDGLFTASTFTDTLQSATIFALTQDGTTSGTASMVRIRPNAHLGLSSGIIWEKTSNNTYGANTLLEGSNGAVMATAGGQGTRTTSKNLNTLIYQQSQILAYENGGLDETLNTVLSGSVPVGDVTLVDQLWLGQNFDDNARPFNGTMQEVIIYFTDQSANRVAIEANINNQYDIY